MKIKLKKIEKAAICIAICTLFLSNLSFVNATNGEDDNDDANIVFPLNSEVHINGFVSTFTCVAMGCVQGPKNPPGSHGTGSIPQLPSDHHSNQDSLYANYIVQDESRIYAMDFGSAHCDTQLGTEQRGGMAESLAQAYASVDGQSRSMTIDVDFQSFQMAEAHTDQVLGGVTSDASGVLSGPFDPYYTLNMLEITFLFNVTKPGLLTIDFVQTILNSLPTGSYLFADSPLIVIGYLYIEHLMDWSERVEFNSNLGVTRGMLNYHIVPRIPPAAPYKVRLRLYINNDIEAAADNQNHSDFCVESPNVNIQVMMHYRPEQ